MNGRSAQALPQFRLLTALRGVAAWYVVLFHLRGSMPWLGTSAQAVLAKGYLAVDVFFLLSGFVIYLSAAPAFIRDGRGATRAFFARRIARIAPLYYLMLAAAMLIAAILYATGRPAPDYPLAELPLHLALMQNWGFTPALSWNVPGWSLSAEVAAYLLFPVWMLCVRPHRWPPVLCWLGLWTCPLLLSLSLTANGYDTLSEDTAHIGLWRCLAMFAAGTFIAICREKGDGGWRFPAAGLTIMAVGAVALVAFGEAAGAPSMLVGAMIVVISLARDAPVPGLFVHLGTISYSTYLSHYLIWQLYKFAVVTDVHAVPRSQMAIVLGLILMTSAGLYRWYERPAQRSLLRLFAARAC